MPDHIRNLLDQAQAQQEGDTAQLQELVAKAVAECDFVATPVQGGDVEAFLVTQDMLVHFLRCARFYDAHRVLSGPAC